MRINRISGVLFAAVLLAAPLASRQNDSTHVTIRVDAARTVGPMTPIWAWFGSAKIVASPFTVIEGGRGRGSHG